jgi:acetolactate synthase-1/3 small subunit
MEEQVKQYTVCALTENKPGVLHRLSNLFAKRKINVSSLTVSETENEGYARFTITINATESKVDLICKQITKIIEVASAHYYSDEQLIATEVALFRYEVSKADESDFQKVVIAHNADIKGRIDNCIAVQKVGSESEINEFRKQMLKYKLVEFVRSGRIVLVK